MINRVSSERVQRLLEGASRAGSEGLPHPRGGRGIGQETHLDRALAPVREGLAQVRERMLSQIADPVAQRVAYLISAGGKRLRPALVLLCGASGPSPDPAALRDAAAAVELIHTATLIHDDIIDESPRRRAQPTFHHRWGMERAVLMGDYLYATAFTLLSRLARPAVTEIMAEVCRRLCRGELREVEARYRLDLTEKEYLAIIRDKTASLVGGCCRSGATLGGCNAEAIERFTAFGTNFGLAFQIIDDCLDVMGNPDRLGKSIHADLDKGILSLPILYLAQQLSPRQRRGLFAPLLRSRTAARQAAASEKPAFIARVAKAAEEAGAIAKAREKAHFFIRAAEEALAQAPLNGLTKAYAQLTEYALSRQR